ncbi:MAG: deoxyribonuclease IV [Gemmataceae bacterium]|nr:deoxyribonuclease IV [Gemmataceae bacterium]
MPHFGAHMSVAGGPANAVAEAVAHGCGAVQVFTKAPSQWAARPLEESAVAAFRDAFRRSGLAVGLAHDSYLINLASPDEGQRRRSIDAFVEEMRRAEALGLHYLVMHPGAHLGGTAEEGLARVAAALDEAHAATPGCRLRVLVENTAGQGTCLGHRFEHLAAILDAVAAPERLGVCFDTCHAFAAGYALSPRAEYEATMRELDRLVGLEQVRAFHVNDSLKPFGSRLDRHAHLGRGEMALEPFRALVNDARFADRAMILETAKEDGDEADMDAVNLAVLRGLVAEERRSAG